MSLGSWAAAQAAPSPLFFPSKTRVQEMMALFAEKNTYSITSQDDNPKEQKAYCRYTGENEQEKAKNYYRIFEQ